MALLAVLFERAQADGVRTITADVLNSNDTMIRLLKRLIPVEVAGVENGARELLVSLQPTALAT